MSNYYRPQTYQKARKCHECIACCAKIEVGEQYAQQTGFNDGLSYRNKYHNECYDELVKFGDFEFTSGCIDPPERLLTRLGES